MEPEPITTERLKLLPLSREEVLAHIEQMPPQERAEVSSAWLAEVEGSHGRDPWLHGFTVVHRTGDTVLGRCGFKGPPDADRAVEIAYGVDSDHRGKGYATEAVQGLLDYAFGTGQVRSVRAHTLPESNASSRVLAKCGFRRVGEVLDPDDGLVWCWEKHLEEV